MNFKVSRKILILFILLLLTDHCLWLVNSNTQKMAYELSWIIILLLFIVSFAKKGFKEITTRENYNYNMEVLFTIVMGLYSSVQSMILYGQSFLQGMLPQRFMLVGFLLYFVITKYLNNRKISIDALKNMFLTLGYIELVLYISQFLVVKWFKFLQFEYTIRLDGIRMNFGSLALPFVIFNSINNIFKERRFILKDAIIIVVGFFYAFGIAKTRILLVTFSIAIIGGFLLWKTTSIKKLIGLFVIIIAIAVVAQTSLFAFLIEGLNNEDRSSMTRVAGREYYLSKIAEHPIVGCGYISTNNQKAWENSGNADLKASESRIGWVDLGFYGLAFFFGIIGLIWFIILYAKMTYQSFKIAKKGNLTYLMYMIYCIVGSPNAIGFLWSIGGAISFVLWICMIENEYKRYYIKKYN